MDKMSVITPGDIRISVALSVTFNWSIFSQYGGQLPLHSLTGSVSNRAFLR